MSKGDPIPSCEQSKTRNVSTWQLNVARNESVQHLKRKSSCLEYLSFVLSIQRLTWISKTPLQFHQKSPLCNFNMPLNSLCGHTKDAVPRICLVSTTAQERRQEIKISCLGHFARFARSSKTFGDWRAEIRWRKRGRSGRIGCWKGSRTADWGHILSLPGTDPRGQRRKVTYD